MSTAKDILEEKDMYRQMALEVLKDVKAIEWCICGRIFRQGENYDNAYAYGTNKAKEKYCNEKINFDLLHAQIKEVLNEALINDKCPNCEE